MVFLRARELEDTLITRTAIVEVLGDCFEERRLSRGALIDTAVHLGAPAVVTDCLRHLTDGWYASPRDLWKQLPGIPID